MILEIKISDLRNNCLNSYERKAIPISYSWKWKQIAISDNEKALIELAQKIPLDLFYLGKRKYRLVN